MSVFDKLEVFVRYSAHPATVSPLGRYGESNCDIIDETGEPVFLDTAGERRERISVEFGSRDVALLLARDHGALVAIRVQVAETAEATAAKGAA